MRRGMLLNKDPAWSWVQIIGALILILCIFILELLNTIEKEPVPSEKVYIGNTQLYKNTTFSIYVVKSSTSVNIEISDGKIIFQTSLDVINAIINAGPTMTYTKRTLEIFKKAVVVANK